MGKKNQEPQQLHIDPMREYSRRYASEVYSEKRKERHRYKRIILSIIAALVTIIVLFGSATLIYFNILQNRLSSHGDVERALRGQLTERKAPQDPFYILLLGTDGRPGEANYRSDTILLARLDPHEKKVTLISIPRDIPVNIPGHGRQKINAAHAFGGPRLAVQTISEFCGVPITHYVEVTFDGFKEVVDALGGVEVDVPKRIKDRDAGHEVLEPGVQVLNGDQALMFCRSRKFKDGDYSRMRHQRIFLTALADKVLNHSSTVDMLPAIDSLSKMVLTDMSVTEIMGIINDFEGMDTDQIMTGVVPSEAMMSHGTAYVIPFVEEWKEMMARVDRGEAPELDSQDLAAMAEAANRRHLERTDIKKDPDNKEVTVTVKNGARLSGAATTASELMKRAGFDVIKVGDIDDMVYDKTMVIYRKGGKSEAAEKICKILGVGEPVKDDGKFKFNGDILIVVGTDWARSN